MQCAWSQLRAHVIQETLYILIQHSRVSFVTATRGACTASHLAAHECMRAPGPAIFAAHRRKLRLLPARSSLWASAGGMKGGRSVSSRRYPLRHSAPAPSMAHTTACQTGCNHM